MLRRIQSESRDLNLVQDSVNQSITALETEPLAGGVLLRDVALLSGSNQIPHRLGHQPISWLIPDLTAPVTIYRKDWDDKTITLITTGACVVSLWVGG